MRDSLVCGEGWIEECEIAWFMGRAHCRMRDSLVYGEGRVAARAENDRFSYFL